MGIVGSSCWGTHTSGDLFRITLVSPLRSATLLAFALVLVTAAAASTGGATTQAAKKQPKFVILNAWDAKLIPALRKKHPGIKVLAYENLTLTVGSACSGGADDGRISAAYCNAAAHHQDWFLTTPAGKRLNSAWFPRSWMMDVGSPAYRANWLESVLREVRSGDWDGVFVDDADADPNWHLQGRALQKYPTMKSWQMATRGMLKTVGTGLMSRGFLFIPNIQAPWSSSYNALSIWKDWLRFTSGASQEYFTKWGDASSDWFTGPDWTFRQSFQRATEKAGKYFLGITYAPRADSRSKLYAQANLLLYTTGGASLLFKYDREMGDPTTPTWV